MNRTKINSQYFNNFLNLFFSIKTLFHTILHFFPKASIKKEDQKYFFIKMKQKNKHIFIEEESDFLAKGQHRCVVCCCVIDTKVYLNNLNRVKAPICCLWNIKRGFFVCFCLCAVSAGMQAAAGRQQSAGGIQHAGG